MKIGKVRLWTGLKRVFKVGMAVLVFGVVASGLNFIYVDLDPFTRVLWHHYYEDEGKIQNLYIGSSHVYCNLYPAMLDSLGQEYNFNLASPSQVLNGSYYLLKEADQGNELEHVYLELYYWCNVKDNFCNNKDPIRNTDFYPPNWNNTYWMRPSLTKLEYMLSIGGTEDYVNTFLPFTRYRDKLNDQTYKKKVSDKKNEEKYRKYEYRQDFVDGNGYEEAWGQGYLFSSRQFTDEMRCISQSRILFENPMGTVSEEYLRKIIYYCDKKGIPLTLFVAPMDNLRLISTEQYDNYIDQIQKIAEEYDLDFYDFNLAKEEYLPIGEGKYFRDVDHLNHEGAKMFTAFFHDVMTGSRKENEKYFYTSYAEKLSSLKPEVYGLYYRVLESTTKTFYIASNREEGMEYRICVMPNEGEECVVQDFDENKVFGRPIEESGVCIIEIRMTGDEELLQTLRVNY